MLCKAVSEFSRIIGEIRLYGFLAVINGIDSIY